MPESKDRTIRAVVYREGDWWIAQCLEVDLVTAQKRREDLPRELRRAVELLVAGAQQRGVEPFYGYGAAPLRFWKMYEAASEWTDFASGSGGIDARLAA